MTDIDKIDNKKAHCPSILNDLYAKLTGCTNDVEIHEHIRKHLDDYYHVKPKLARVKVCKISNRFK